MDVKAYIESGILESYVMGLATAEEIKEVQAYAVLHPEIRKEILLIEDSLGSYANAHSKQPPQYLKEKILSNINPNGSSGKKTDAKILEMNSAVSSNNKGINFYLAAASVALLVMSLGGNYFLYDKWQTTQNELAALNSEKTMLAQQMQIQQTSVEVLNKDMMVLKSPFNKTIALKSLPASNLSQDLLATVYWNQQTKEVFINVNSLPSPPVGKQYQLWALADGKPIDAGVFEMGDTSGLQKMKVIESAQAFAVTLEQKGGSPSPTLEAMYVMGGI
jgi:anti-sigma-K factor RskA